MHVPPEEKAPTVAVPFGFRGEVVIQRMQRPMCVLPKQSGGAGRGGRLVGLLCHFPLKQSTKRHSCPFRLTSRNLHGTGFDLVLNFHHFSRAISDPAHLV